MDQNDRVSLEDLIESGKKKILEKELKITKFEQFMFDEGLPVKGGFLEFMTQENLIKGKADEDVLVLENPKLIVENKEATVPVMSM